MDNNSKNPSDGDAVGVGVPWSLCKLVKRQSGGLYIHLPTDAVLSSNEGEYRWTLTQDSKRVVGPDGTLTSLLITKELDVDKPLVLAFSHTNPERLTLVPVSPNDPRTVRGAVLEDLRNPLIFLPGDFSSHSRNVGSHREMVRFLWRQAPEAMRRDLAAEQAERNRLLALPHFQSPVILWLLGHDALERSLGNMGVVSPSAAAGEVACSQVEQPVIRTHNRQLHIVLRTTSSTTSSHVTSSHVRLCLPYLPGAGGFAATGFEYHELGHGELVTVCPVSSQLAIFAQQPARVSIDRVIFAVLPTNRRTVVGDAWKLLQESGMVQQDAALTDLWSILPEEITKALDPIHIDARKTAGLFQRALSAALMRQSVQLSLTIWAKFLSVALYRWGERSLFSRLVQGFPVGEDVASDAALKAVLLRSFRRYAITLASLQEGAGEKELREFFLVLEGIQPIH